MCKEYLPLKICKEYVNLKIVTDLTICCLCKNFKKNSSFQKSVTYIQTSLPTIRQNSVTYRHNYLLTYEIVWLIDNLTYLLTDKVIHRAATLLKMLRLQSRKIIILRQSCGIFSHRLVGDLKVGASNLENVQRLPNILATKVSSGIPVYH